MNIKHTTIKKDVSCSNCNRSICAGTKGVLVMDYLEIPYNDKCFCNDRCLGFDIHFQDSAPIVGEGNV